VARHATISTQPCDFRPVDATGVNGPFKESWGAQPALGFALNKLTATKANLQTGKTYYLNIRNWSKDLQKQSCLTGTTCDMILSVSKP